MPGHHRHYSNTNNELNFETIVTVTSTYLLEEVGRVALRFHQKVLGIFYVDDHFFDFLPDLIQPLQTPFEFLDGKLQLRLLWEYIPSTHLLHTLSKQ